MPGSGCATPDSRCRGAARAVHAVQRRRTAAAAAWMPWLIAAMVVQAIGLGALGAAWWSRPRRTGIAGGYARPSIARCRRPKRVVASGDDPGRVRTRSHAWRSFRRCWPRPGCRCAPDPAMSGSGRWGRPGTRTARPPTRHCVSFAPAPRCALRKPSRAAVTRAAMEHSSAWCERLARTTAILAAAAGGAGRLRDIVATAGPEPGRRRSERARRPADPGDDSQRVAARC